MAASLVLLGIVIGSGTETAQADAVSGGGDYISFNSPTRVLNTQTPLGVPDKRPLPANTDTSIQVTGVGGVPSTGVTAVMATVAVANPSANMVLRIWPSDGSESVDSIIHSISANTNFSTTSALPVGVDGKFVVKSSAGTVDVVIDVQGYFTSATSSTSGAGGFVPVTQTRLVDSRSDVGTTGGAIASGARRTITVPTSLVPASASAMYVNVLVPSAGKTSTLWLAPGADQSTGGNIFNYIDGHSSSGLSVKLSGGKFTVRASSTGGDIPVHVVIDVFGYWSSTPTVGAGYRESNTGRLIDTRVTGQEALGAGKSIDLQVGGANGLPVENVAGVLLNIHAAATSGEGSTLPIKAWPTGTTEPAPSVVNGAPNVTRANMTIVRPGTDGKITIKNGAATAVDVFVELEGWFADPLPKLDVETNSRTAAFQAAGADSSVPGALEFSFTNNAGQLVHGHIPDPEVLNTRDTTYTTISDGEVFTGTPVMVQQPNRLLSISGQRTNALAWGKVQTNASTGAWPSSWSALGGSLASRPTGGKFSDGRIVQFGVDSTGALWVQSQASANGAFGAWTKVANTTLADSPTVVSDASNNVLLFARTTADTMVVASYSPAGALSAWTSLGKPSTEALDSKSTPSVLVFNDRIRVFVTLPDGSVLSKLQDLGGVWTSSWQPVGDLKAAGPVAAVVEPTDGTAQVFARSGEGTLAWVSEVTKASSSWTTWMDLGVELATNPTPLRWADSQMARFGLIARVPNGNTQIVDFTEATKPELPAESSPSARKATPSEVAAGQQEAKFYDLGRPD
ncbi:PLL family lectin [Kineosporia succinea]|uniref:PLL-like beta propeller domain-containing protein n=1 Tax=Kineosporia succinea TaxID=84632 RepID=A0ABT9PBX0_9ACTN|nr:hypothetical protein [Kineosporia succinea]MDP9830178.1 hypothetical protein [Kineosporia succinea]